MSIAGSNWNPFMSPFKKATLISHFPLSMLPSRPFRCSQRHQTHLHFLAGVITKDKTVLKGSKFTGVFAFGKENFQSLWNTAPWFQPGVNFTPEDSIRTDSISLRVFPPFPPNLLFSKYNKGHGLIGERNSAERNSVTDQVFGQLTFTSWTSRLHILKISLPWEFPGSPVFRTLCFQCRGQRFDPWLEN